MAFEHKRSTASIEGVINNPTDSISRPTYRVTTPLKVSRAQSPPLTRAQSPTMSDFGYTDSIYTLNNQYFSPDQTLLNMMFNAEKNREVRKWFFQNYYTAEQSWIRGVYFDFLMSQKRI